MQQAIAQAKDAQTALTQVPAPLPGHDLPVAEWLARYAPDATTAPLGPHHWRVWDWIESLAPGVLSPALVECWARGYGKSTTVELGLSRVCVKASRRFAVYVSGTQESANRHVSAVAHRMEHLGIERAVNKYGFSRGWKADLLRTSSGFNVLAFGLEGGQRGVKLDQLRPDIIILDDVDRLGDSADTIRKNLEIITQTILPAGSPDCAVAFVQNKIHANSVMAQILDGQIDMLRNRVQGSIVPAIAGLQLSETSGVDGRTTYRITGGTANWDGKPLSICEAEINTFGLQAFLRESQHETGAGGLLFPGFQPTRDNRPWHLCDPFAIPPHWNAWASHDFGTNAPCAFHVHVADEAGDIYTIAELYEAGLTSAQQADRALLLLETLNLARPADPMQRAGVWQTRLSLIAFDYANTFPPENPAQRLGEYPVEVWWRRGLPCVRAVKDRKAGWQRCQEWLAATRYVKNDDGRELPKPRWQLFRGAAPHLARQLQTAMTNPRDPDELDPGFRDDHALDSLRYGLMVRPSPSAPPVVEAVPTHVLPLWMQKTEERKL